MTRAAGYIRVSTEEQRKNGWNLDADRERIEKTIDERGWTRHDMYDDGGRQGDDPGRPEFNRMLAEADDFDVLIMRDLDRFSRKLAIYAVAVDTLVDAGVTMYEFSGDDGTGLRHLDLDDEDDRLMADIKAAVAQQEKAKIKRRVRQATTARVRHGKHHGRLPYGYGPGMVVIEHQAAIVRRIFGEYTAGVSQREITRRLNREGVRSQRGDWTQGAISKTLGLSVYIGKVHVNGHEYEGDHEPIIDMAIWQQAQAMKAADRRTRRGKTPTANHLLAGGMLRCRCGAALGAATRNPKVPDGQRWEAYTCATRQRHGPDACPQPPVKRQLIDDAIFKFVTKTALDLEATRTAVVEHHVRQLGEVQALLAGAERDVVTAQDRLARVRRDYTDGRLDVEDWRSFRDELTGELDAAKAQVTRLTAARDRARAEGDRIDAEGAVLESLTAIRASILGQAREGSAEGAQAFRAALRRLFVGFELVQFPNLGDNNIGGIIWPQDQVVSAGGYVLVPHVRELDLGADDPMRKLPLPVRASNANTPPCE